MGEVAIYWQPLGSLSLSLCSRHIIIIRCYDIFRATSYLRKDSKFQILDKSGLSPMQWILENACVTNWKAFEIDTG